MMDTERIYIGGLSPSKGLTVDLVASRLMTVPNVEIVTINDAPITHGVAHNNKASKYTAVDEDGDLVDMRQFFFLEARCNDKSSSSSESSSSSALELLARQYNNTKWKGCQLRVESARPHFLKRLEMERAAREEEADRIALADEKKNQSNESSSSSSGGDNSNKVKPIVTVRRRLRIRKRHGEEAYHVDAHPQTINITDNLKSSDWEQFASLHKRLTDKHAAQRDKLAKRRREERKKWMMSQNGRAATAAGGGSNPREDTNELKGMMFLNRGIHIRFNEGGDDDKEANSIASSNNNLSDSIPSDETSIESDCADKGTYVWSDDSNDESSAHSIDTTANSSESSVENKDEENGKVHNEYVWSDEDSADGKQYKKDSKFRTTNTFDEFSGGMDFDVGVNNNNINFDSNSDDNGSIELSKDIDEDDDGASVKLEDDIRSNLDILSKLFPGESISNTPVKAATEIDADSGVEKTITKQSGIFGSGLIVQRYDPTKEDEVKRQMDIVKASEEDDNNMSANEHHNEAVTDDSNSEESTNHQIDSQDASEKEDNAPEKEKPKEANEPTNNVQDDSRTEIIYEQDKLENIFKQAREDKQTTGFSFGAMFQSEFGDVAAEQGADVATEATGFTFGSMFESQLGDDAANSDGKSETTASKVTIEHDSATTGISSKPKKNSRTGLRFPTSVLNKYEELFFSLNEGPRVIADRESMRNDSEAQEKWQKEREVLTLDWKRKQKSAQSRKVKKRRRY
eukprot:scaffold18066_cov42-Cyclotella_meneghiniana.AAC.2